jgi:Rrf2 family protein
MGISRKCQYALRAVFELAKRRGQGPTRIGDMAKAQAIPQPFLGLILAELKSGGFVESVRGPHGGYLLTVPPNALRVGEIIRFVDGPVAPVDCVGSGKAATCPLRSDCAFMSMWKRARDAVAEVYDATTFQALIDAEGAAAQPYVASYCI